eukprot:scaffold1954_cov268-Pinguiococcus_pyrenoidosus.AAC.261
MRTRRAALYVATVGFGKHSFSAELASMRRRISSTLSQLRDCRCAAMVAPQLPHRVQHEQTALSILGFLEGDQNCLAEIARTIQSRECELVAGRAVLSAGTAVLAVVESEDPARCRDVASIRDHAQHAPPRVAIEGVVHPGLLKRLLQQAKSDVGAAQVFRSAQGQHEASPKVGIFRGEAKLVQVEAPYQVAVDQQGLR